MMKTELRTVLHSFSVFLFSVMVGDFSAASTFRKGSIREKRIVTSKTESVPICLWYSLWSFSV